MRTRCELSEKELRKLLKVKQIKINVPSLTPIKFYWIFIAMAVLIGGSGALFHSVGYSNGMARGYDEGYTVGYNTQLDSSYSELTLYQAIAHNIKHNLDGYIGWFGLVVGLGWILHGVGFKLAG